MGRWEPDAGGRLRRAAMELFLEQGFEQTTVAQIGERAGVTSRTFFRYFADKREVLFAGSEFLENGLLEALATTPPSVPALEAVAGALEATGTMFPDRGWSGHRMAIIAANPELTERELIKMARLSRALAEGLRGRGVAEPDASLAAESGVAVFRVAFDRWVTEPEGPGLAEVIEECFDRLRAFSSGGTPG